MMNKKKSNLIDIENYGGNPDFLIIGVQKGGTSSLFYYLSQHPKVMLPLTKEIS